MRLIHSLTLIILFISFVPPASASFWVQFPLDKLFVECDFAFTGVAGSLTPGRISYQFYEFTDIEYVKNDIGLETVQIRISGNTVGDMTYFTSAIQPSFVEGERYLVFVSDNGGVFWVFGGPGGYYLVDDDPDASNIIRTRSNSTMDVYVMAGTEHYNPSIDDAVLAYSMSVVLVLALFLCSKSFFQRNR